MIEFIKTKKTYIAIIAVLFLFVSLSETTYSLFLKSNTTGEVNYNTGLLDLTFVLDEPITLDSALPMRDSDAVKNESYTLTVKNTGSLVYLFDLKMLSDDENTIDYRYIKVKVNDYLPHTLASTNNVIDSNVIIYPNEEITYYINVWLDKDTPNNELGKVFNAKVVATGKSVYKTIDTSGANHPKMDGDMIPVYYDKVLNGWKVADKSNMNVANTWYNYAEGNWANSVTIKNGDKQIYDLTGRNNIKIDELSVNNGNVIIEDNALDLKIANYDYNEISNILRVKFDNMKDNVYIISNGKVAYYYNVTNKTFIFKIGDNTVTSEQYEITKNKWHIVGYTYDGEIVTFYADGNKLGTGNISGNVNSNGTFKLGTDGNKVSKITVGDALFYNRILSESEVSQNYRTSFSIIYQNLLYGYSEFTPMTPKEHYLSSTPGIVVMADDISAQYVWIPRYKYRVWNVLGEKGTDSYDVYHQGVDIIFENLDATSGTIYCNNTNCYSDMDKTIAVTSLDNDKYYTHPAFSTTTKELTGFWISKYEVSNNNESKIGNEVLRNTYLSTFYTNIKQMSLNSDYHVIKNTEWGAIVYLSHSKYGICANHLCGEYGTNETYTSGNNNTDTTTGNMYGVFDLSGSAMEYTMGNITPTDSLNIANTTFKDVPLGTDDYDLYTANSFILGDATNEVINWFDTPSTLDYSKSWIIRGNVFDYDSVDDSQSGNVTTRIVIK